MTIEKLLECSANELEAMSNDELLEHFKQYLPFTRPELAQQSTTSQSNGDTKRKIAKSHRGSFASGVNKDKLAEAREILRKLGKDVRF